MKRAAAGASLLALICCAVFSQSTEAPAKFEIADVHASPEITGFQFFNGGVLRFSPVGLLNPGANNTTVPSAPSDANAAPDPSGALSLFDAIYKQLGLKLEKQKRMAPVLVIDHIDEKPTEN